MFEASAKFGALHRKHPQCHPTYRKKAATCHQGGGGKGLLA